MSSRGFVIFQKKKTKKTGNVPISKKDFDDRSTL